MSSAKDIIKESINKDPVSLSEALAEALRARASKAVQNKIAESISNENDKQLKRGHIIDVDSANKTHKFKAVMTHPDKAVYLDDEGNVEHVPEHALKTAIKSKRTTQKHKDLANEYLKHIK